MTDKRALGDLIPSRTLGDIKTKRKCPGAVIAVPEVSSHPLLYGEDCALVLASDGLWDELKNAKVMELLCKHYHPNRYLPASCILVTAAWLRVCTGMTHLYHPQKRPIVSAKENYTHAPSVPPCVCSTGRMQGGSHSRKAA